MYGSGAARGRVWGSALGPVGWDCTLMPAALPLSLRTPFQDPLLYIKEINYKSKSPTGLQSAFRLIKDLQKRYKQQEQERQELEVRTAALERCRRHALSCTLTVSPLASFPHRRTLWSKRRCASGPPDRSAWSCATCTCGRPPRRKAKVRAPAVGGRRATRRTHRLRLRRRLAKSVDPRCARNPSRLFVPNPRRCARGARQRPAVHVQQERDD